MTVTHHHRWQFWIDRGGTFTDIVAKRPDGKIIIDKLLSENPEQYQDAAIQGIRDILGISPEEPILHDHLRPRNCLLDHQSSNQEYIN